MSNLSMIVQELQTKFSDSIVAIQATRDDVPTIWVMENKVRDILRWLKCDAEKPYRTLYDLTAIDERVRTYRHELPDSDFTLVYHLLSYDRNEDLRIKVPLKGEFPAAQSVVDIWPCANWYEREVFDLFGVKFLNHPDPRRIMMPDEWEGHPLRKDYPVEGYK